MIPASDGTIGQKYKTSSGILIEILEKRQRDVVVKSYETGHSVPVSLDYKLTPVVDVEVALPQAVKIAPVMEEKIMSSDTAAPTAEAPKTKKLKKSNIVDAGLKLSLSVEEITKNVLATFPETLEKSVHNLISVRRSKFKKTA